MGVLKEKDKEKVANIFKGIEKDVKIVMFTQEMECPHCEMTRMMLEEVSDLSDKLSLEVHDFVAEADLAKKDYGIRFYGVPAGYEFNVLVEDIMDVGKRDPGLSQEVMTELARIDQPVHMQVLISPA
jgi:alkyl hydroperoxide reductase subunit AhpF